MGRADGSLILVWLRVKISRDLKKNGFTTAVLVSEAPSRIYENAVEI